MPAKLFFAPQKYIKCPALIFKIPQGDNEVFQPQKDDVMNTNQVIRKAVPTSIAAEFLNRKPQTLRKWACLENGPIRPIRINGRLAWYVDDLASLLNGGA